jgi:RNA polymerase sigma factor (sigma-70 family)
MLEMLGATSATPSRAAALNESRTLLESAIARLPADYAMVVQLYDLEGNSIAEVAVAMKRSAGAVHMLRARAHDSLRELLGRESIFFSNPA